MNKKIFKVRYTVDRESFQSLEIAARGRAEAYVSFMTHIPEAEIVSIICISDSWLDTIAKFILDKATVQDIKALCNDLSDEQQDVLIDALHNLNQRRQTV